MLDNGDDAKIARDPEENVKEPRINEIPAGVNETLANQFTDGRREISPNIRIADRFEPNPAASAMYEDLYQSVYLEMYARLKLLYREIRRITGYPPPA